MLIVLRNFTRCVQTKYEYHSPGFSDAIHAKQRLRISVNRFTVIYLLAMIESK